MVTCLSTGFDRDVDDSIFGAGIDNVSCTPCWTVDVDCWGKDPSLWTKAFCEQHGLKMTGNKQDLLTR